MPFAVWWCSFWPPIGVRSWPSLCSDADHCAPFQQLALLPAPAVALTGRASRRANMGVGYEGQSAFRPLGGKPMLAAGRMSRSAIEGLRKVSVLPAHFRD